MYDLIIIGGGPAAVSAGIYAARKNIKTAVIADNFGGQSIVSHNIQNWIGTKSIAGWELARNLEEHLRSYKEIDIIEEKAVEIVKLDNGFLTKTILNKEYISKTLLICSGGKHKRLGVEGEEKFIGKGVAFCSTCDAPFFRDKDVLVVGSGNSGLEAVLDLFSYAKKVYLFVRRDKITGDSATYARLVKNEKLEVMYNVQIKEIVGDYMVSGVKYINNLKGEEKYIDVSGVFVEIGMSPNSDIVKHLVELNERGEIKINARTGESSMEGIWAAGDVSDVLYKQNNIAAGDAIRAVLNIHDFLLTSYPQK